MTRINLVDPRKLSNKHLVAEYREILRIPNLVKKALQREGLQGVLDSIPVSYRLGAGHVNFFKDKGTFLAHRFVSLITEMATRGFEVRYCDPTIFIQDYEELNKDYIPTILAIEENASRIYERGNYMPL